MDLRTRILVVEDDHSVRNLITTTLKIHDYSYATAATGAQAIAAAASQNPDIILLDLGLPDMDGSEVIRKVRSWSNLPIIIISARSEDSDKITALDAGADDYLTKPFSVAELLARIRATERRLAASRDPRGEAEFHNGPLCIRYASEQVEVQGESVHLTPIEYRLLTTLARNLDRVLTHSFLISQIWGASSESNMASLRVYMTTLRRKLEKAGAAGLIETHVGVGYCMIRSADPENH